MPIKKTVKKKEVKKEVKPKVQKIVCNDINCAIHGTLAARGRVFVGKVISDRMEKTITVEWPRRVLLPKYERYEKRRSRVKAHNPKCINAKIGQKVKIAECRPLSKTKTFVVMEVIE